MARPFYPYEADDPDLDWLISNFLYERPDYIPVDTGMLPLVMLPYKERPRDENAEEETFFQAEDDESQFSSEDTSE